MLKALHVWSMSGVPANPSAWITRVAMNLAKDALRHQRMSAGKEPAIITHMELAAPTRSESRSSRGTPRQEIRDDALRLLFVCCHPSVAPDAQVVLALKVLCGFQHRGDRAARSSAARRRSRNSSRARSSASAAAGISFDLPEGDRAVAAASRRRARRALPALQRRLQSLRRRPPPPRRSLPGGDPRHRAARRASGRRHAAQPRVARAHVAHRRALSFAARRTRRPPAPRRPGPHEMGPGAHLARARRTHRRRPRRRAQRVSPPGRHRRAPLHRRRLRRDGLAAHRAALRCAAPAETFAHRRAQPRGRPRARPRSAGRTRRHRRDSSATASSRTTYCTLCSANSTGA
jgi:hypothetical protein